MLDGRINRQSFWVIIGPMVALQIALSVIGWRIPLAWVAIALVCVPRLHDIGRTGKWVLAPLIVTFVGGILAGQIVPEHQLSVATFGLNAATLLAIIWLGSEAGEPVSNLWGAPTAPGLSFGKPSEAF